MSAELRAALDRLHDYVEGMHDEPIKFGNAKDASQNTARAILQEIESELAALASTSIDGVSGTGLEAAERAVLEAAERASAAGIEAADTWAAAKTPLFYRLGELDHALGQLQKVRAALSKDSPSRA